MDIRKLQRAIVDGLEDVKAQHIVVFNTEHLSPLFERVIVASGTSNRQTKALASSVREAVKAAGLPVLSTEGGDNGEWIIVDCGAAVAHIMQPAIRDYYRLEEIWGGKPVNLKLGGTKKGLPKAAEPSGAAEEGSSRGASKRPAARKTAAAKRAPAGSRAAAGTGETQPVKRASSSTARAGTSASSAATAAPRKKAAPRKTSARTGGKSSVATPAKAPARTAKAVKAATPATKAVKSATPPAKTPTRRRVTGG